jgi:hypothetical protein
VGPLDMTVVLHLHTLFRVVVWTPLDHLNSFVCIICSNIIVILLLSFAAYVIFDHLPHPVSSRPDAITLCTICHRAPKVVLPLL